MAKKDIIEDDIDGDFPPRLTRQLIGHDAQTARLAEAFQSGRMHHAWLLAGQRGIGKASFAYLAARAILSGRTEIGDFATAAEDETDRLVAQGAHPDLYVLRREYDFKKEQWRKDIIIADARDMIHFTTHSSAMGGWRVCILDSVDELNFRSTNALLKTLEEPPMRTVFFLVCHRPGAVLPTILSRCMRLDFAPLAQSDIEAVLATHAPDASADARAAAANLASQNGAGSIGYARALLENGGLDIYRALVDFLQSLPQGDIDAMHGLANRFARKEGEAPFDLFVTIFGGWLCGFTKRLASGAQVQPLFEGEADMVERLCATTQLDPWLDLWNKVGAMARETRALNLDRKQTVLDWLAMTENASQGKPIALT